jgi:ribosomal protein S18 acetylase RimI-like enzyme
MKIVIRPWQKSDLEAIRRITWQSWMFTYSSLIPERDLTSYFHTHYTETSVLGMINDPSIQGFIADVDDQVAGYARLFFNRDENRLYVSSLYLLPDVEGKGIGIRLLDSAEGYAAEKGLDELWIGVMVRNRLALLFYRKAGFLFIREEPFTMGKTTVKYLIGYKKSGRSPLPNRKTYTTFDGGKNLSDLCLELLSEQKRAWQDLREGYDLVKDIKERDLACRGFSVRLQYNSGRMKSSTAELGKINAKERQCFLCLDQLPEVQKGILYRNDYLILSNPMPIFSSHFTISHIDHRLQTVEEHLQTFFQLSADFGPDWTILYNGPKCGASAPDHFHFQAGPSGRLPIEKEIRDEKRLALIRKIDGVLLYRLKDLGREVIILEGDDSKALERAFNSYLAALREILLLNEEPMINVAGFYEEKKWRLVIFPRRKHRPDVFSKDGDARVVVSPGVIEMGGLLITPVKRDFERLDASAVESIYKEVSLDPKTVKRAIEAMR